MYRGTTPTLKFRFKYNLEELDITAFYITFVQNGEEKLEMDLNEIKISGDTVIIELSQEDTLSLEPHDSVYIQARIKVGEKAYATNIIRIDLNTILKEGVI